jgi:predicted GNAT family acetyltransferase
MTLEVSAVVTHPNHTGKGYAKQLVVHTVNEIFKNKIKFLIYMLKTIRVSIQLYKKLGFKPGEISFLEYTKQIGIENNFVNTKTY